MCNIRKRFRRNGNHLHWRQEVFKIFPPTVCTLQSVVYFSLARENDEAQHKAEIGGKLS